MQCWITDTFGMFDSDADESGHDKREYHFQSWENLRVHLRTLSIRFADVLAEVKSDSECELLTLGPEYLGVAYVVSLKHCSGSVIHVGISPDFWVITNLGPNRPKYDGPKDGRMVVYFRDWTEWKTAEAFTSERGKEILAKWFEEGA